MTRCRIARKLSILMLIVLTSFVPLHAHQAKLTASDMEIYAAVARYQIRVWDLKADTYCIQVNGKDPSHEFLKLLAPLAVKPASACVSKPASGQAGRVVSRVVDKKTGKPAVIFDLDRIERSPEGKADVEGGYDCASQCSGRGKYRLDLQGTEWIVKSFDVTFQS